MISPPSISAICVTTRFMNSRSCDVISSAPGQRLEERLEPDDRLDVEVVGRLVHQQDVGPAEQHARHRHAHLPAAGQRADVAVDALVVEAEAVQHFARLRSRARSRRGARTPPAPRRSAPGSGPCRRRASGSRHRVLQRLELVVQVADAAAAGNRLVEHRAARHLLDVLAEVADRQLLRHRDLALVGRLLADDHAEERGLAGAVRADQADLLAGVELEGGVDEEDLPAVLLADAGERNHAWRKAYHWCATIPVPLHPPQAGAPLHVHPSHLVRRPHPVRRVARQRGSCPAGPRQRRHRRHARQQQQLHAGHVGDRTVRRLHVVRLEPRLGRQQRRAGRVPPGSGHGWRRDLRRGGRRLDGPRQPARRHPGQRRQRVSRDHAGWALRGVRLVRVQSVRHGAADAARVGRYCAGIA